LQSFFETAVAPDVLVASTNIGLAVLHELNKAISTVFAQVFDPVGSRVNGCTKFDF
jgi:hypothetical protein